MQSMYTSVYVTNKMAGAPPCISSLFVARFLGRVLLFMNPDRRHRPQGLYKTSPLYFHPDSAAPWTLAKKSCMTVNTRLSVTRFGNILWTPTLKNKSRGVALCFIYGVA